MSEQVTVGLVGRVSRVEVFAAIRRDARVEGLSIRQLARKHGVHRRTVRQALASAFPPPRKPAARSSPKLDPFKALVDGWLREDLDAPRKQRHTARRVHARLVEERSVVVSYSTVRDYVARRRPEIAAEAGRTVAEVFVPQTHEPGAEAEVDFADLWVILRGIKTKVFLFTLRLSYSGKSVHRAFATQGQEAFLEGHAYALAELGGVPVRHIRYDNLKAAVSRVLQGRGREESDRWVAFRSHYGFDAFYCQPGIKGAHEKGGVEGEGGRFRRTHCVPMPVVDSIAELNDLLAAADAKDDRRRVGTRLTTIADDFAFERRLLGSLPVEEFPTWLTLTPRVDRHARINVRSVQYSVPARLIGRRVRVELSATELRIHDGRVHVATHERSTARGGQVLDLDHYLEVLAHKPGALPGATALSQARARGAFTPAHDAFWAAARKAHGDAAGTRELIDILLLHRHLTNLQVVAGLTAALTVGATTADVVAVEARRVGSGQSTNAGDAAGAPGANAMGPAPVGQETSSSGRVLSLTARRLADPAAVIAGLPADTRPLPTVDAYDQLLRLPTGTDHDLPVNPNSPMSLPDVEEPS